MLAKYKEQFLERHENEMGSFFFYKNFIIAEMKEGVALNYENSKMQYELGKKYYGNKTPFVYISHRLNSYSITPTDHYKSVKTFPNLVGLAIVSYSSITIKVAELEKAFLDIPVNISDNLDDALYWAEDLIISD
ncbi:hypothetical protein GCM10022393_07440 [Aquimarina addita]|uniref:Uncharacterized protein n=1 Tax=Aquimarina addita TaxID=870485 RepID=A0ABP7XBE7_9FLAO